MSAHGPYYLRPGEAPSSGAAALLSGVLMLVIVLVLAGLTPGL